ncbi:MAG: ATP-grasp domain-containing protein [Promicromonosporaceae bacterium]|nr:ATP-grasp domain-containing protein [Promicromonosporaceae bacterium]
MQPISVLVTGGGGDIGRGLAKILRDLPYIRAVYGADLNPQFPHEVLYDGFAHGVACDNPVYLTWLADTAARFRVDLVIPMAEPEIRFFAERGMTQVPPMGSETPPEAEGTAGVPLLLPSSEVMRIGFSKLATAEWLAGRGLPFPWTVRADEAAPQELPCIMKSDHGSGSKALHLVTRDNLAELSRHAAGMIYQELLLPDESEHTCGVFRSRAGQTQTVTFRRVLAGGRTGFGQVVSVPAIDNLLAEFARDIGLVGSVNVQLRLTDRGPVIFEINPRFSSTVVFRHLLGFRDVDWAIRDHFGALEAPTFDVQAVCGKRIFRADAEIIY